MAQTKTKTAKKSTRKPAAKKPAKRSTTKDPLDSGQYCRVEIRDRDGKLRWIERARPALSADRYASMVNSLTKRTGFVATVVPIDIPIPPELTAELHGAAGPEPAKPAIEPSVFRVAIADLTDRGRMEHWNPSSVWETPDFDYAMNGLTLINTAAVGDNSLEACRKYVASYNGFKMLEKNDLNERIKLWALVICGLPESEDEDEDEDEDD